MTTPTLPAPSEARSTDGRPRRVDLALARAHLRLGSLALARTELETLAGLGALDAPGLVDLAEVRWRTGDLPGAGEAAVVALDAGADDPVALVIAAEAASADGRPGEARRLATLAMSRLRGRIDRVFAGMPRSAVWPPDAAEPPPTAGTLFHRDTDDDSSVAALRRATAKASATTAAGGSAVAGASPQDGSNSTMGVGDSPAGPLTLGFWDADSGVPATGDMPDPDEAFHAGRAALVAGAVEEAAFRFSLALRFAPALAPAVLEAVDGARSVPLIMVRGDAYRLVGHESEARQAYALAAQGGPPERRRRPRTEQKPDLANPAVTNGVAANPAAVNGVASGVPGAAPAATPVAAGAAVAATPAAAATAVVAGVAAAATPAAAGSPVAAGAARATTTVPAQAVPAGTRTATASTDGASGHAGAPGGATRGSVTGHHVDVDLVDAPPPADTEQTADGHSAEEPPGA